MPRLNPASFNRFLAGNVRQDFTWRRAYACPCVATNSGAGDQDCETCGGLGWAWAAPVAAWAGMTNMSPAKANQMFGVWDPNDATLTVPSDSPLYDAGRYDRIRAGDASSRFSRVVKPNLNPRLIGEIIEVDRVFWITDDVVVDGKIPTITDGLMTWPDGGGPPAGQTFSVSGRRYDELFVFTQMPQNRNSGVDGLPRKLPVRGFDLFGRAGGVETPV